MSSIKIKAFRGVIWSALERYSVQGVRFMVSIVLARLLAPEDFGLIAIVMVFTTIFMTVNEAGFNTALIHKQDRDDLDFSTAFYTNIVIGVISYAVIFALSPLIARFYDTLELVPVMRILSLNLLISSLGIVQNAKFTIKVDFKTQAKASLTASVISGLLGILIAYKYRNVYGIVAQSLSYSLLNVCLMWYYARWRPLWAFSFSRFKGLFEYAYKLILARVLSVVFDDIYALAIGKLYSNTQLGFYNRAGSFRQVFSKDIINIIQRVSVPLLCEAQDSDDKMKNVLLHFLQSTAAIVYPLLAGLMILGKPFIRILIGEKWLPTADLLLLLCPSAFFYLISTFNRNVYNATGHTDWALKAEVVKKAFFIIVFLITFRYSMTVLLIGLNVIAIFDMFYDACYTKKQIGVTLFEQFKALFGVISATAIMSGAILLMTPLISSNPFLHFFCGVLIGFIVYSLVIYVFNIANFRDEIYAFIKKMEKK